MAYSTRNNISEQQHNNAHPQAATAQFVDNRTSATTQLKQQTLMAASPTATAQRAAVNAMNTSAVQQQKIIQRAAPEEEFQMKSIHSAAQLAGMDEEELLQGKFETTQLAEDEELLQGKFETAQRAEDEELLQGKFEPAQRAEKPNNTGLPDNLKSGIENLSGMSMDHVKVHYNSEKPAQLQAHAYAQGSEIHVAPGQEQHLPHEAWHVVQQKQGRVKPTIHFKANVPVNDNQELEHEADVMGLIAKSYKGGGGYKSLPMPSVIQGKSNEAHNVIQPVWVDFSENEMQWDESRGGLIWFYNVKTRTMRFESNGETELGDLGKMVGEKISYRAWIKEWHTREFLSEDKAESLSFSNYISHIIEIYPPEKFEYVGIGASTDLVLGYMKTKYGISSVNVLISGVTNVSIDLTDKDEWSEKQLELVTNYITAFIPLPVLQGGKQILIMDVTSGGTTLNVMEQFIKKIVELNGGDPKKVRSFSLNTTMKPDKSFNASTDPDVLSKPVPMNPENVESRKPSEKELSSGFLSAGTVVDEDSVPMEYVQAQQIKEEKKTLKKEYKKLNKPEDKEKRTQIKKKIESLKVELETEILEYYPKLFDMMITDTTDIEDKLDDQDFKKTLGRSHRKVNIKDIMSGETDAEKENKVGDDRNNIEEYVTHIVKNEEMD